MSTSTNKMKAMKRLSDVSAEEFLRNDFDDDSSGNEDADESPTTRVKKSKLEENDIDASGDADELKQHKRDLDKLKETDPAFYEYLQQNDQALLDFNVSDLSDDESGDEANQPLLIGDGEELQVASDDSEYEDDAEEEAPKKLANGQILINNSMIKSWAAALNEKDVKMEIFIDVIEAFVAAAEQVEGHSTESTCKYKSNSSLIFNEVMAMCVIHLPDALRNILRVKQDSQIPINKCKRWSKVQVSVKKYLNQLIKILNVVNDNEVIKVLLKHVKHISFVISASSQHSKKILKRLISIWSSKGDEEICLITFLAIVKITEKLEEQLLEYVIKTMYMSYVRNVKFTSPSTWPLIHLMQVCLVELFKLNERLAYKFSFEYIRQLALLLRNAIQVKKKDAIHSVYNWQYIHCLGFWSLLLSKLRDVEILQELVYPLVQIITGTIKLIPTAKYYPLRFHCVSYLIKISKNTGRFVSVLPLITEVLDRTDFNAKGNRQSFKPMDFHCMLKVSKSQLDQGGFKDTLLDYLYDVFIQYLSVESSSIGFPELTITASLQLKSFLKKCKVANYCKRVKQLLAKMEENSKYIIDQRKTFAFKLSDVHAIKWWENKQRLNGTPLDKYYKVYRDLRKKEKQLQITKKEQMEDVELPTVNRKELIDKHKQKDKQDLSQLFSNDNDSDDEFFVKKSKNNDEIDDGDDHECEDLTISSSEDEVEDEIDSQEK
ncbi:Nucleolar complex protein 2 [Chamberlinius hualienensis]